MTADHQRHLQIQRHFQESIAVKRALSEAFIPQIAGLADELAQCLKNGGKILFCGNGGSAADAQHLSTELVVRLRSSFERPALAALALTVDTSVLTATGNDYGFEHIFSRQVEALGKKGDILIGMSTSGNSPNILAAVEAAGSKGIVTVGFLGGDGGKLGLLVDHALIVPSGSTARIQESHILIGHILCELVEESLFSDRQSR